MDDWERERREAFQREQRESRDHAVSERQSRRQNWQEKREVAKLEAKGDAVSLTNEGALERLFADAELSIQELYHEFLYGEWAKENDHDRELELALVELNRMEHSTNLEIRIENNRHENAKDFKTHETDELIRLKRAFGQLTPDEQKQFFAEFDADAKRPPQSES